MCPFCIGTAAWITAGVIASGGASGLAVTRLWKNKSQTYVDKEKNHVEQ